MVSKASDDLPEPDSPVKTISRSRGSSGLTLRGLCPRAPLTTSESPTKSEAIARASLGNACSREHAGGHSHARLPQLALELAHLVAQPGGVLEAQVGGRLVHLLLQGLNKAPQLGGRQVGQLGAQPLGCPRPPSPAVAPPNPGAPPPPGGGGDVVDGLAGALGLDAVLG